MLSFRHKTKPYKLRHLCFFHRALVTTTRLRQKSAFFSLPLLTIKCSVFWYPTDGLPRETMDRLTFVQIIIIRLIDTATDPDDVELLTPRYCSVGCWRSSRSESVAPLKSPTCFRTCFTCTDCAGKYKSIQAGPAWREYRENIIPFNLHSHKTFNEWKKNRCHMQKIKDLLRAEEEASR